MKRIISTAFVSLLVSCMMLAIYHYAILPQQAEILISTVSQESLLKADDAKPMLTNNNSDNEELTSSVSDKALAELDFRMAAQKTMPAVVHIKSNQTYSRRRSSSIWDQFFGYEGEGNGSRTVSTGSGVIISADGYIVTNNHVIENADELEVTLFDNQSYSAKVIGTYPITDLGLIKIEGLDLPFVELANSDEATVGEWVLAVGNPFNLSSTATAGIVSAIGRDLNIIKGKRYLDEQGRQVGETAIESFIQTDAAVNPGNSGGALVNLEGKLLGINTAIASPTGTYAGYAFAVPANIVRKVVEDLMEFGKVQRGYIGIEDMESLNANLARQFDVDITEGVLIKSMPGPELSGAAKAGIRPNDIIVSVDGINVKNEAKLLELIARNRPGDEVSVTVYRRGDYKTFKVTLTDTRGNTELRANGRSEILSELGVEFVEANESILKQYGFEHGVAVSKLVAGEIRRQAEMKENFIIIRVNGDEVGNVDALVRTLERSRGNIRFEGFYPGGRYLYEYVIEL